MHSGIECLPCAIRQCRQIVKMVGGNEELERKAVERAGAVAKGLSLDEPPSTYTSRILLAVMSLLDSSDPFKQMKAEQNRAARPVAEKADREIAESPEPLKTALMLAAAGNVIDPGPRHSFSIDDALKELQFAHDDSDMLIERLDHSKRIMYILDNSGEVMFDILVLKRLPKADLVIVARPGPILNDVTVNEAKELGLEEFGRVIGTGSQFLGVDLATVSDEFRKVYENADVVIAKGHANFESLVGRGRDGFFVLTAKCELVAEPLGVKLGESACFYSEGSSAEPLNPSF
ncbi:hypothetical protein CH330_02145 [candidate division WOR-3 bacterium JGI_Cruoil_03_51_56]|uniref:Damage-control phosphatase ARMT1-like metal-binding domain-containing protein n=1 Tax=candidate division WOR-3 bacterium JGI_Cruoil_03_51_56 TaxID=1973747 RepID=A0A235BX07_UNCW3|nr:MAG: hypothetical protein CH330_02145 [candidate division WOR-3 bacterium JGI_Cruoil_03_51_56]